MSEEFESRLAELREQLRELQQDDDNNLRDFQAAIQKYRHMTMVYAARRVSLIDALNQLMHSQPKAVLSDEIGATSSRPGRADSSSNSRAPEYHKETCWEYKTTGKCTKHNCTFYHTLPTTGPPGFIPLNAQDHRIDMMMRLPHWKLWKEYNTYRQSGQPCVDFHIRGECDNGEVCRYAHGPPISDTMKSCMKYRLWNTVCDNGGACRRLDCLNGHHCHFNPCTRATCVLSHGVDTRVVRWVPAKDNIPSGPFGTLPAETTDSSSESDEGETRDATQSGEINLIDM
ncbi:uncharacterized protein EI97DRAFT_97216 [Westerdykella ornata]|uniref:C3H1-type domain-containing protein n=1 Tax=Westerdykella ornata TaxID=318751 RepID=A0A6A6JDM2_WESOR|nr:uncharacterized protein EI97DRAFT_97216 [Westerdykella ornata]KAF2274710.1 hypothetical protein EI97DRAFT_97216 [Westerdykella ornata]